MVRGQAGSIKTLHPNPHPHTQSIGFPISITRGHTCYFCGLSL